MKEKKKDLPNQPQTIKKMAIGTYVSIITLNVNGLSALTKTQTGWMDTKTRPIYMHLWVPYFRQRRQEYTMGQRRPLQ